MPRLCRTHLLAALALAAPLASPSLAFAQGAAPAAPGVSPQPPAPPGNMPPPAAAAPPASSEPPPPAPSDRPALITPAPAPPPVASPSTVNPARDQQALAAQGTQRPPENGEIAGPDQEVFSDEWWGRVHPIVELHGYFRTRGDLFQNLFLGRHSSSFQGNDPQYLAPIPLDNSYTGVSGGGGGASVIGCGSDAKGQCHDQTETSADMRLRLDPEIIISDNLRIETEILALDNVVLGSTPEAYAIQPANTTPTSNTSTGTAGAKSSAYASAGYNPYAPIGFFSQTQGPPTAGVNSLQNSINVQRVWGEYMTPLGQLRFGRMPGQWGLGILENAGDGIDSDYQTTLDRIMFITGIKPLDLYFGGAWDFPSSGPTNTTAYNLYGGEPYNVCNLCNVGQWAVFAAHKTNPEVQRLSLARGDVVINGGAYTRFREQYLDVNTTLPMGVGQTPQSLDTGVDNHNGLEPRHAWEVTPDLWVQLLWQKFRLEAEGVANIGEIGSLRNPGFNATPNDTANIRQWGVAAEVEYKAIEDKLRLQFKFGWASGNPWSYNTAPTVPTGEGAINPGPQLPQAFNNIGPLSQYAFHPDYRVDLIFFRNILTRVEGAYYFRPSVDYDFLKHPNGEKFGGGAAVIWSRASDFIQSPGHHSDLGIELDAQLYYQSKDGSLNDDPSKLGGFFAMLQYGVFFPLAGLDYFQPTGLSDASLSTAQIVRLFLGVAF